MARTVLHQHIARRGYIQGVLVNLAGTLCGRSADSDPDINVAEPDEKVTCKLCLKKLEQARKVMK